VKVKIFLKDENLWLTQKKIADLFNVDRTVITKHLKNIFTEGELSENSVCAKIALTAEDGKSYQTTLYNLDCIISVGYRVNSTKATQFRIWATERLKKYDKYHRQQMLILESDFDKEINKIVKSKKVFKDKE
jgi:hypothetical protein